MKDVNASSTTKHEELLLRLPVLHRQVVLRSASTRLPALRKHRVPDDAGEQTLATRRHGQAEAESELSVALRSRRRVLNGTKMLGPTPTNAGKQL